MTSAVMHCGAQTISRIPSPKMHFTVFLDKTAEEWTVITFVATDEKGMPMGFFRYAVNVTSLDKGTQPFVVCDG